MMPWQKLIKNLAIVLAICLACSIILGIVGAFIMIFGFNNDDSIMENAVEIAISQEISSVEISVAAVNLKVFEGDHFALYSNIKNLLAGEENGTLIIKQKQKIVGIHTNKVGEVLLMIPTRHEFNSFNIESGAGNVEIEFLQAVSMDFEFGAGSANIDNIVATKRARIEMGAGKLNIDSGVLNCLDLDLGVGKTVINAKVNGTSSIECGVGNTHLNLIGMRDDYCIDIDTGIGSISVDGTHVGGSQIIGNGPNRINIDGGVGSIVINYNND